MRHRKTRNKVCVKKLFYDAKIKQTFFNFSNCPTILFYYSINVKYLYNKNYNFHKFVIFFSRNNDKKLTFQYLFLISLATSLF